MIDLRRVHEKECFEIRSATPLSLTSIGSKLKVLGFRFTEEFAFAWVPRLVPPTMWQTDTLLTCGFWSAGHPVYADERDFDIVRFSVLVASLPREEVIAAVRIVFDIAAHVQLPVSYGDRVLSSEQVPALVDKWCADILAECGDVSGSESVGILIEMEYNK